MEQVNAAQNEPWWQEFTEQYGKESLRSLAKRFGTNPRRLRRAAQRCGLADEPEAIRAATERLGKLPDASLAEELGVTPEQVKGARSRRSIPAFNPKTLPQPRTRTKKSARKRPQREYSPRESRERFVPTEPTVVVKKPTRRAGEGPARSLGRVEDSGRKLRSTLGRLHKEEASRGYEEPDSAPTRRRRVVGPDRLDELRGLRGAEREPPARGRRRRLSRKSSATESGGDDDGSGPGAKARIEKAFGRLSETLEQTRALDSATRPPARHHTPVTRVLRRVEPSAAAPVAAREAQAVKQERSQVARPTPAPKPAPALVPALVQPQSSSPVEARAEPARLWNAVYEVQGERHEAVVSAPTFVRALERVQALGELLALTPADVL